MEKNTRILSLIETFVPSSIWNCIWFANPSPFIFVWLLTFIFHNLGLYFRMSVWNICFCISKYDTFSIFCKSIFLVLRESKTWPWTKFDININEFQWKGSEKKNHQANGDAWKNKMKDYAIRLIYPKCAGVQAMNA